MTTHWDTIDAGYRIRAELPALCTHRRVGAPVQALAAALMLVLASSGAVAADPVGAPPADWRELQQRNEALMQAVQSLQREMAQLKQQVAQLQQEGGPSGVAVPAGGPQPPSESARSATAVPAPAPGMASAAAAPAAAAPANPLALWGYGEIYYLRPTHQPEETRFDLARAVFGIGYQFDEQTRFNSEYEVEHGVSSASDVGEFEVEQFYVERQLNDTLRARAGLFLIPAGLLNESHEPTNFYGVQRNFVETLIIPSTWREGGASLVGTSEAGLDWSVGLTSGLDLSKWEFTPTAPLYGSALELINNDIAPMQASHQELALANGRYGSEFVSLNYRGVPGLTVGGSVFTGLAVPSQPTLSAQRATLWETHARYQPGRWDLSGLYARGSFSGTGAANALAGNPTNPLPAAFDGWYAQAAYNAWQHQGYRLAPFARYEKYDLAAKVEGVSTAGGSAGAGFAIPRDTVLTMGANFYLNSNVVLKLDYQRFKLNTDFNRVDLGLGLQF